MNKKILIVEDENNLNVLYDMFIRDWGYDTVRAYDGVTGLEAYRTESPDAILTDSQMPKMNGQQLVDIIRQTDIVTPILFHTGGHVPTVIGIPNLYIAQKNADLAYIQAFLRMALENPAARQAMTWVPRDRYVSLAEAVANDKTGKWAE